MSDVSQNSEIVPYLNPNYWEGHTLGYGDAQPNHIEGYALRHRAFIKSALEIALQQGNSLAPLHTFETGEIFDASSYHPGTVVFFREENLRGRSVFPEYLLEDLTAQDLPVKPKMAVPGFSLEPEVYISDDQERRYRTLGSWVVVPETNDGSFIFMNGQLATVSNRNKIRVTGSFKKIGAPIVIGETVHIPEQKMVSREIPEEVRRINVLHVIASGTPKRARQRIFGLKPRPASLA